MIGFIGAGSMGSAIMKGAITSEAVPANQIFFSRRNADAGYAQADQIGAHFKTRNSDVVSAVGAGVVVLAVKPQRIGAVLDEIRDAARDAGSTIVSIAAGIPISALESHLHPGQAIVRAMPNVAAKIGVGMTALARGTTISDDQFTAVERLFAAVGEVIELPEKQFSAFTAIAGSAPAWTFQYIDSLSRGALADGMSKADSLRCAAQGVLGAAQLALTELDAGVHPQALIDTVTSPGGTTIAGLIAAERNGFSNATLAAVRACIDRDRELSHE
ncbi:MAG: pyrroline-5-carboxylate reductase [Actinomycetaceae bacterium]|nr:pyrroline-5-carboxylate reductase [Actinomycetaceae bacterium]MDY5855290.1 pyrroline-5-carboxylate reductase [Arcanobacterium sp.]